MPRVAIPVASVVRNAPVSELLAGDENGNLVAIDQANGHSFINTANQVFMFIINTKAGDIIVTVGTATQVAGLDVEELVATIGQDDFMIIGPFTADFHQDTDKTVYVDFDSGATGFIGPYLQTANND